MTTCKAVDPADLFGIAEHVGRLLLARNILEVPEARYDRVNARALEQCVVAAQCREHRDELALRACRAGEHLVDRDVTPTSPPVSGDASRPKIQRGR